MVMLEFKVVTDGERNEDGERLLEKLFSYKSGRHSTVVDYVLFYRNTQKKIRDVKIIRSKECFTQHRLLAMDVKLSKVVFKKYG